MKKLLAVITAAFVLLVTPVGAAHATQQPTVEVTWLMPESGWEFVPFSDPRALDGRTVGDTGFPQTLLEGDIPCERWVQIDTYYADDAATITADGILTYGEDWDEVLTWRFVYGGECAPPPVDECPNLDGNQATIPEGYVLQDGECVLPPPPVDVCPNIDGDQSEVPEGYIIEDGECVLPPGELIPPIESEKPPHLAETGVGDTALWIGGLTAALLIGGVLLLAANRKLARKNS